MLNEYSFGDIYIRHAIDENPDDQYFNMHIHEQCEIYFFVTGCVEYLVEGSKYPLDDNSLMIMRPSESHKARIVKSCHYERYAINFPPSFVSSIDPEQKLLQAFTQRSLGKDNLFTSDEIDMNYVKTIFSQMCKDCCDYDKRLTITTHLYMLLDMICKAFPNKAASVHTPQTAVERMVIYINNHLTEDISIPEIASHFYLSPSQFSRVFRKATGSTPWEYIIRKRLTAANEMMRQGAAAQKACDSCGFNDYSSFYRAYVKYMGHSPSKINNGSE